MRTDVERGFGCVFMIGLLLIAIAVIWAWGAYGMLAIGVIMCAAILLIFARD